MPFGRVEFRPDRNQKDRPLTGRKEKTMKNAKTYRMLLDLQLFAEGTGGDGGTGADGATGVTAGASDLQAKQAAKNPLANVRYGIQEGSPRPATGETDGGTPAPPDRNAEFEKLIKGEYKDLYNARVQDTVQKRLKSTKETVEKYEALTPVLEMLSRKYGADASDVGALVKAIEEDDSYYEEEALEKGISVERLKEVKKLERENAELKRQMDNQKAEKEAKRIYEGWIEQAERAKAKYPSLDLNEEIKNPQFASLLRSGIDVDTAFTVVHKDEIIPAAMGYAAQQAQKKTVNRILANGARPTENGISPQSSAVIKSDVSQLSKEDRAEIIRRVARGEKIRF